LVYELPPDFALPPDFELPPDSSGGYEVTRNYMVLTD